MQPLSHTPRFSSPQQVAADRKAVRFGGITEQLVSGDTMNDLEQLGRTLHIIGYSLLGGMGTLIGGGLTIFISHQRKLKRRMEAVVETYKKEVESGDPQRHKAAFQTMVASKNHHVRAYAAKQLLALPDNVADTAQKMTWARKLIANEVGMGRPIAEEALKKLEAPY